MTTITVVVPAEAPRLTPKATRALLAIVVSANGELAVRAGRQVPPTISAPVPGMAEAVALGEQGMARAASSGGRS